MRWKQFALLLLIAFAPPAAGEEPLSVLSYNVQNLFDADEQGGEYDDFRAGRWDAASYAERLTQIAAVLRAAPPGGADVVALQEVENRAAALDLRDRLRGLRYRYAVAFPNEGADLGLTLTPVVLSRVPVLRVRLHQVWHDGRYLRPIVEVALDAGGGRPLYLFNNHWKSKLGGAEQTEPARRAAAAVLAARLRELQRADPAADVLIAGDLNEDVDEHAAAPYPTALYPAAPVLRAAPAAGPAAPGSAATGSETAGPEATGPDAAGPRQPAGLALTGRPFAPVPDGVVLYSPWLELPAAERGTVVHRGEWGAPDHFLLSAGLFDRAGLWYRPGDFAVIRDGLVSAAGHPRRWTGSYGQSDHLPIVLYLRRGP